MQTSYGNVSSSGNQDLRNAIRLALATGAGAAAAFTPPQAVAADESASAGQGLEEVVVTGTRIRRIDAETASPVVTVSKEAIEASGLQTAGELLNQLPVVSGAPFTAAVNNGGGFGEANVELRGLDARRTLVLLNGRRIGIVGASGAVDVNQIPVAWVDHVEVLKEGAGAIYGSDAVGGVVNFITRKNQPEGLDVSAEWGQTSRNDGEHTSVSALWSTSTDRTDVVLGGSYAKQEAVSAGDRQFAKFAQYLYSGLYCNSGKGGRCVVKAGSSRVPTGRVSLPRGYPLRTALGCGNVTRIAGTSGTSQADYECLTYSFNYQPYNLVMTPQERGALFSTINYKVTDAVEAYAEVLYNKTHSGYQIAPLPFDAISDNVTISSQNIYNPFGLDFGRGHTNFRVRLTSLGDRQSDTDSDSKMVTLGLKGRIAGSDWQWDLNGNYERLDQTARVAGYIFFPQLSQAVGPSFQDATGTHCGTPGNIIAGCTPLNIFNIDDPASIATLRDISTSYGTDQTSITRGGSLNFNGPLFALPAGKAQAAVGAEYRELSAEYTADKIVLGGPPLYNTCLISSEACTGNSYAKYNDKELYGELFVPLIKDMPGAKALNLDVGVRYSDYSEFGNSTNWQVKLDWRPVDTLLLRATYAQVFRVPTLADISAAPASTNPTFQDPCYGLTAAAVAANPNLGKACVNVPLDGSYQYNGTAQIDAILLSNANLKPETGDVWTYGLVWDVKWVDGLSFSVDNWSYHVKDLITQLDPNYSTGVCLQTGDPFFCNLVTRLPATDPDPGRVFAYAMPTINLGELKTDGVDLGVKYDLKHTRSGSWHFSIDTTYTNKYDVSAPNAPVQHVAGTYDRQFGNYARWRGLGAIGWSQGGFDALFMAHYIHSIVVHEPATVNFAVAGTPAYPNPDLQIPAFTTYDLTLGYMFAGPQIKVQAGVQNLTDKQPPILYQNNVINANTDVSTYDTIGSRYFVTVQHKF